jgi:succinate-acetate transporter protein
MSVTAAQAQNDATATGHEKNLNGEHGARAPYNYGGNPLAHAATNDPNLRLAAFGGEFQPGLYRAPKKGIANPAPLGLSAFALTTFILSLINMNTRNLFGDASLVVGIAYGYGGLVQLLAGMWEMAVGNTFGATALSSYGGFWISFGIILTPGGFEIVQSLGGVTSKPFANSFGLYLEGWFIFTFVLLLCTLRSTLAFFLLFFTLDMAFLLLGIGWLLATDAGPNVPVTKAGGAFGILAAFLAWYNALAGIADSTNSFFVIPVLHFPWSEKGREQRAKVNNDAARAEQSV